MHKLAVAALLAAGLSTMPGTAQGDMTAPTRIMVVGDSVSHGLSGDYTWRYFSYKGLQRTNADVDFVGPHVGTYSEDGWFAGTYADPDFDKDHAARYGLSMWQTLFFPGGEETPSVEELMASQPDVVVDALGVNDLMILNQTPEDLARYVGDFVRRARAVDPDVDVVVMALPQTWIERVPTYNALLPSVARALSTPASRVVVTPVADFTRGVETYDDAHPTMSGMRKIAEAVSVGLEELGIGHRVLMPEPGVNEPLPTTSPPPAPLPGTPAVTAPTMPDVSPSPSAPGRPHHVRARRMGRRTAVTWRRVPRATGYTVRCGHAWRNVAGRRAVLRAKTRRCAVRAEGDGGKSRWVRVRVEGRITP